MSQAKKLILFGADLLALYAALAITLLLRYGPEALEARYRTHIAPFSLLFVAWILIFSILDLYRHKAFVNQYTLANSILGATSAGVVASIILFYLFEGVFELTPKTNLFIFAAIFALLDYLLRSSFTTLVRRRADPVVVIGDSPRVRELISYLNGNRNSGYRVAVHLPKTDAAAISTLPATLEATGGRIIIVETGAAKDPGLIRALYGLLALGVSVVNFPDFYELVFERVPLEDLEEAWFIDHV